MNYVGVDLHQKTSWFYVIDSFGNKIDSKNVTNSFIELNNYFNSIPKPFTLAVESTYNWYFFVDLAEEYADQVYLANSYELKAFAKRNKKTDKIDAELIAAVIQKGFLPTVTIADKQTRELRELLRCRMNVVSDRSRNIHRLKALLDRLGLDSNGDFSTYKRLKCICTEGLSDIYSSVISSYIKQIEKLIKEEKELEKTVAEQISLDEDISNLLTIPGVGNFSAALIKSEIIDIGRFRSFSRLCAYAGLAPRVSQSGSKTRNGPLNRNRRKNLQWILLETVIHFIKSSRSNLSKFNRISRTKSFNTARVVLARDMLRVIYKVLKEKRQYYREVKEVKIQSVADAALIGV